MKSTVFLMFLIGILSILPSAAAAQKKENQAAKGKTPVLVELFTSEGCSSCPPADRVLTRLEREQPNADAEIITLAFHVDYWNYLGWRDEFSSHLYSERQGGYGSHFNLDSNYTPQMVVDGQTQFVGSNFGRATDAVAEAVKNEKAPVEIFAESDAKNINFKIKIADAAKHDESYVWLAIAEDDISTNVRRGENSGRTLRHTSVAREMKWIGNLLPKDDSFAIEVAVPTQANWNKKNLKAIVFVQGKSSKKIFALRKINLS